MTIGEWVTFAVSLGAVGMAALVMFAYRPASWVAEQGAEYLRIAIFGGAAMIGLNAFYWGIFGTLWVHVLGLPVADLRTIGNWTDLAFKGGSIVFLWMHLLALHSTLDKEDQSLWGILEMAFYPQRRLCLLMLTRVLKRRRR